MTEEKLAKMFYDDIMVNRAYGHFEIQKYFKEFIVVLNGEGLSLPQWNELQYDNFDDVQFIRDNMTNEEWHLILSKEFSKNNLDFKVLYYNKKAMLCTLYKS